MEEENLEKREGEGAGHREKQLRNVKGNLQRGKCGAESRQETLKQGEVKFLHLYR